MLNSGNISLNIPQLSDVDFILKCENDQSNWGVSNTVSLFTRDDIESFVRAEHNLKENKQIRYIICLNNIQIGTIDLFEYNSTNNTVGVGILIAQKTDRGKGYATEALKLLIEHCRNELNIVNVFCNIQKNNEVSISFFEKNGFQLVEERKLYCETVNYYENKL